MDFQLKDAANVRRFPGTRFPRIQDGLRALTGRAPQAEARAASCIARLRPFATLLYGLRRRIATIAVAALAGSLFVHVMFGANGMVVYKQKRAEFEALRQRIAQEQQENEVYTRQIQGLKTDQRAIEREAREQLRYARPGEFVYVAPAPANAPPATHSAKQ